MRKLTAILLFFATPVVAQSPCDGKIQDKVDHDMNPAAVSKPAAGESYVDPVFGTLITRISNANPAEGENAVIRTLYATLQGWNSDNSLIIAWHRGGGGIRYEIYAGDAPYTHLDTFVFTSPAYPSDIEQILWSNSEPLVLYFPSALSGPRVYKHTINLSGADTTTLYRDFSDICAHDYTFSMGNDPYQSSNSANQTVGLKCYDSATGKDKRILYSITNNEVLATILDEVDSTSPWALPDGTGAFFQCQAGCASCASPSGCLTTPKVSDNTFSTTLTVGSIYRNFREHQALSFTPGGYNTFNRVQFDQQPYGSLIRYRLDTGAATTIVGMDNGWPYPWGSSHVSSGASNGSGWVALGIVADGTGASVTNNELMLANVYTSEVCRVAHLRTQAREGVWGYWGEAHPQISRDGYRVLFTSDWFASSTVDLYVADLRPQDTTVITTSLPNGVTAEAYSKTLQALGGVGAPYNWTKTAGTWPDGISMGTDGIITGTPTTVETQIVTVQACDGDSPPVCDTQQLTLVIQQRPSVVQNSPLAAATVGTSYGVNLTATGGVPSYTWSLATGTMCAGLTLGSDGSISGTPTTLQTCNFTVRVIDSHAQPIAQTKAFAITVSLPGACLPGASSVCMKTFPSATRVYARYGQMGLPAGSSCTSTIKLNGSTVQAFGTQHSFADRFVLFTGLSPSTLYTIETSCAGLTDLASDVLTTSPSAGTRAFNLDLKPSSTLLSPTQVTVEWGTSVVSDNSFTDSNCGSGCRVTLNLAQNVYLLRHTWKNAGGTQLAQSDTRYLAVP